MTLRFRSFINEKLRPAPKRKQDKSQYAGVEPGSKGWKKGKAAIGISGYSQSGRTLLHKKGTDLHFHDHGDKIVGASDPNNPNTYFRADKNRIKEDVDPNKYLSQGSRKTVGFNKRIKDLSPEDQKAARKSADRKTARDKSKAPKGSRAAHNVIADAGRRYRVGDRPVSPTDPKHKQLRINKSIAASMDRARARQRGNRSVSDDVDHSFVNAASVFLESTPAYRKMMKNYAKSDDKKVFDILKKKGFRVGEQDDTLVRNMLKKSKGNVKKAAAEIEKKYSNRFESVEVEEAHMVKHSDGNYVMTTDGEKVKTVTRDKEDAKRFSKSVAKRIANQPTSKHVDGKFVPNKGTKSGRVVREDAELDEMSAKQHYAKFKRGGRGKGFVVSSPIDRDRYPNRERQGLEGPYKSRKSGKIFYYDKKAGKYYDPDSDMYLQVSDVMEANEKIKVKLDPKKKIGYTIHNVGPGGKKTLVKSRDMPGKKDVG